MALVVADMSISLDGYVTGPNDSRESPFGDGAGTLHDWFGDAATDDARAILQQFMDGVGTFVIDRVAGAIERAAGNKLVYLFGATVLQQALPLGLVDEIHVHVVAVLIGAGTPLFGSLDTGIPLERTHASMTPAATHPKFRVLRQALLSAHDPIASRTHSMGPTCRHSHPRSHHGQSCCTGDHVARRLYRQAGQHHRETV